MEKKTIKTKVKTLNKINWRLWLVVTMVVVGGGICYLGNLTESSIIIALGFFLLLGGVLLFINRRHELGTRILPGRKTLTHPANAFMIEPEEIGFDYIKSPPGHQQRCVNDGKWYSVLMKKPREKAGEFTLPDDDVDRRHYDPREMGNVVTMPANKKLFEPTPNIYKTIAVGVMGLAVAILAIVIVAMSGA